MGRLSPEVADPGGRSLLRLWLGRVADKQAAAAKANRPYRWAQYDEVRVQAAEALRRAGADHDRVVLRVAMFSVGKKAYAIALDRHADLHIVDSIDPSGRFYRNTYRADAFKEFDSSDLTVSQIEEALDRLPGALADASYNGTLKQLLMTTNFDSAFPG
jgi:hypothetical protein